MVRSTGSSAASAPGRSAARGRSNRAGTSTNRRRNMKDRFRPPPVRFLLRAVCQDRRVATGITDEHEALHDTARRWAEANCPPAVPRAVLDAEVEALPAFWDDLEQL